MSLFVPQNAVIFVSESLEIKNFLKGACPQNPLVGQFSGLATPTLFNATPTLKCFENPGCNIACNNAHNMFHLGWLNMLQHLLICSSDNVLDDNKKKIYKNKTTNT